MDVPNVRGTDNHTQARSNSTYSNNLKGKFSYQVLESNDLNKNLGSFILSNKFEYGYDPVGGRTFASVSTKTEQLLKKNEIGNILSGTQEKQK